MSEALETRLKSRWLEHTRHLDLLNDTGAFETLLKAYSEPHRRYHTLQHLEDIFATYDTLDMSPDQMGRGWMATWFHDVIYDTTKTDNEIKSGELAQMSLWGMKSSIIFECEVQLLIEATARHQDRRTDESDNIFLDIDFSILGSQDETYEQYAADIRQEYEWVPTDLYNEGRSKFLNEALTKPRTFLTDDFENRLGDQARTNIKRELEALGVG